MNREAKIGIFVLAAMAAMVYFIMRTSDVTSLFRSNKTPQRLVKVVLDDAAGIREDSDVRIAGVKIGKVQTLTLEGSQAVAVINVPEDLQFREGAMAQLMNQGVLGERYVTLQLGSGELLADQSSLVGKTPASLDKVTSNINRLAENMITITENIKQSTLTAQGDNRLALIAENFEKLTDMLLATLAANQGNVKTTTDQVSALSETLNREIPQLVAEMTLLAKNLREMAGGNREKIEDTVANMADLSGNMTRVSESLSSIARKVDEGDGTLGKLVNEGETVEKLNSLLDSANDSLDQVKGLVTRVTGLDIDLHVRGEYLAGPSTERGFAGITIKPDASKYYQLEAVFRDVDHLPQDFTESVESVYDADGNLISTTTTKEFRDEESLVFNGILAYQVGDIFLKGGLMESTAGAGIDYFNDSRNLRFSMEVFDLDRKDFNPHGKLYMNYLFRDHLELIIGWDEFADTKLSSAMIGGGIRWKDEDLKLVLGNVGRMFR